MFAGLSLSPWRPLPRLPPHFPHPRNYDYVYMHPVFHFGQIFGLLRYGDSAVYMRCSSRHSLFTYRGKFRFGVLLRRLGRLLFLN